jgi:hypothetical protein
MENTHSTETTRSTNRCRKYSIEMSHPQEPSDKMKEEAEVKACCMTSISMMRSLTSGEYYCPMHCEGDKAMTNQEDVRCVHEKRTRYKEKTAEKSCCGTKGIG